METDNMDVTASLPSPLVSDAMTFDVTTIRQHLPLEETKVKFNNQLHLYVRINTYTCKQFFIQQKHKQTP